MAYDVAALEKLIEQFQKIPSIGRKTAQRMAFHVLDLTDEQAKEFADAIIDAHTKIHHCSLCHNLTENELCPICESANRDHTTVCVVEEPRDVLAMERMREYSGVYHVLHGVISPMNGIGPEQLTIKNLVERVAEGQITEVIMATNPTIEGDTTLVASWKNCRVVQLHMYGDFVWTIHIYEGESYYLRDLPNAADAVFDDWYSDSSYSRKAPTEIDFENALAHYYAKHERY